MCGIIASVQLGDCRHRPDSNDVEQQLKAGLAKIAHRGPDASGIWLDPSHRCGLAHCRLSINDLSPTGSQPLHSPDKTIHAIVNGEIYDDGSLRNDLSETYDFTGNSDSELVLALYAKHGLGFLSHLRGEYALCLYDSKRDLFVAARDRYGIKPLFWRRDEKGSIWLGAEIKAFLGPGWQPEWDVDAMADGGWGQDTRTLFKWVNKLRPGHYMTVLKGGEPEIRSYWDLSYPSKDMKDTRTEDEMVTGLRTHLLDSVRLRLLADVPVGIYLSGGIDSSALAGIANHLVKEEGLSMGSQDPMERVCCFSIGFDEESGFDESDIAQRTADWLGVKYVKAHMSESELAARFEDATYHIEHHNHDLNFVGKFALSEVPREHGYKVVLTGEGADENLGGYPLFLPDFLRQPDSSCDFGPTVASDERARLVEKYEGVVKESYEMIGASAASFDRKEKRGLLAGLSTPAAMTSFNPSLKTFTLGASIPDDPLDVIASSITPRVRSLMENEWHPLNSAMYVWSKGHLVNQFLSCLGDRTEMAHSVEARTPFLDHHLTEYMNNLPPSMKIRWTRAPKPLANAMSATDSKFDEVEDVFVEKYALREAVRPFVTPEVYARRKHPYTAPTEYPSGGPMHRTLQQLVTRENLSQLGFVDCDQAEEFLRLAFDTERGLSVAEKQFAWRQVLIVAEWIVLSQRFGVKRAEPRI